MTEFLNISKHLNEPLEKHKIYADKYGKNTIYWGLGIENEVYLEIVDKTATFSKADFLTKHREERYSIDYFANYKPNELRLAMIHMAEILDISNEGISIPILLKSHSFSKTDIQNQPQTNYTKVCEPNPQFSGKTFLDTLSEIDPEYFLSAKDCKWLFDGDTIEFPTRHFYNVTLDQVLTELSDTKLEFIEHLNAALDKIPELNRGIFKNQPKIQIMSKNYAFATYLTNLKNIAMFNNGTLHYNLTLPTELDGNGKIKDHAKFVYEHQQAIRAIQWLEPFLIAKYGASDPFSKDTEIGELFGGASQRSAISRYIGIGTYNTDTMETGKILTKPLTELKCAQNAQWWFREFYKNNGYSALSEIGMDINFNKHYNHGIEVRFLDHLTDEIDISQSFEFLIYLMDFVLERINLGKNDINSHKYNISNPCNSHLWNTFMLRVIKMGKKCELTSDELIFFQGFFGFSMPFFKTNILDIYHIIFVQLIGKYTKTNNINLQDCSVLEHSVQECSPCGKFSSYALQGTTKHMFDQKMKIWKNSNNNNYGNCCNIL